MKNKCKKQILVLIMVVLLITIQTQAVQNIVLDNNGPEDFGFSRGHIINSSDEKGLFKTTSLEKINNNIFLDEDVTAKLNDAVPLINAVTTFSAVGEGVRVCIIDSGLDKNNINIKPPMAEYDFVNNDLNAEDDYFHGTFITGILTSFHMKYKGVSPSVDLLIAKALNEHGSGISSNVLKAVRWCVEEDADIITLSLGAGSYKTNCDDSILAKSVNWASEQGVIVIVVAGNEGVSGGSSPGCASQAISVGGSLRDKKNIASWSSRNDEVDIVAPGEVTSTTLNNQFISLIGTSISAPLVAGSVALLKNIFPNSSNAELKDAIYSTAKCFKNKCELGEGHGFLDVEASCKYLEFHSQNNNGCERYRTDNYSSWFGINFNGKFSYSTKSKKDYKSLIEPKNILFYTTDGYPVTYKKASYGYYYYVWYDINTNKKEKNYAYAWQFNPDRKFKIDINSINDKKCITCSDLFK